MKSIIALSVIAMLAAGNLLNIHRANAAEREAKEWEFVARTVFSELKNLNASF